MIHVSKMTGKLEGFKAVNFNPLTTRFCNRMGQTPGTVCQHCYSRKMIKTYRQSCAKLFTRNAELMDGVVLDQCIPRFQPGESVRFLAHGDMDTTAQFMSFCEICRVNPETHFTMWTKRTDIIALLQHEIPPNLTLIQSSTHVNRPDQKAPGFHAVFTVYDAEHELPKGTQHCNGQKCRDCMHCYRGAPTDISERLR